MPIVLAAECGSSQNLALTVEHGPFVGGHLEKIDLYSQAKIERQERDPPRRSVTHHQHQGYIRDPNPRFYPGLYWTLGKNNGRGTRVWNQIVNALHAEPMRSAVRPGCGEAGHCHSRLRTSAAFSNSLGVDENRVLHCRDAAPLRCWTWYFVGDAVSDMRGSFARDAIWRVLKEALLLSWKSHYNVE